MHQTFHMPGMGEFLILAMCFLPLLALIVGAVVLVLATRKKGAPQGFPVAPAMPVPPMRFRIHGQEKATEQEATFVIECPTVQEARERAVAAGYVVSRVEPL